ncbi:hypothetical protein DFQ04_0273 [Algoriphagus boseongensis]|uniref:Capsule assembly protein Wzi n=1 Tax=Algoriphagus boseongensis TaxID=1442587 RepID=A0A4R6T753_9BACT|nr:hypothetical protein [Algoriphagus boseongensis]TDQ18471.1 hypothetical protein DFQ04_0273 [Algoriphagus boseongensis]
MIRKSAVYLLLFLGISNFSKAQEEKKDLVVSPDIHFRSFWMNTAYPGLDFKKDYALGMSLNLGAKLEFKENLKMHVGYRGFTNVASSEFWNPDPISGQSNRYEAGLFDLLNPKDKVFGKLETLSLEYSTQNFGAKVGRMGINSDWINAQDGRLSPTALEGINLWFNPDKNWKFSLWGISRLSIRGSSEWFNPGETLGIYPQGRTETGKPGNYFGNTQSEWIGIAEIDRKIGSRSKIHFSQTLVQNISSTYWMAWESNLVKKDGLINLGVMGGFQHGIGNGGNLNLELRYKNPEDKNFAISGRVGWKSARWVTHLNVTQVFGKGRWLSPREWGKDAWYTFIPRERNEGFESVTAVVGYAEYRFEKFPIQLYSHMGVHFLPDTQSPLENKYNFPSYFQSNLGLKYQPKKIKNLDFHFILVSKEALRPNGLTSNQIYNKVEMLHFNAILNWRLN